MPGVERQVAGVRCQVTGGGSLGNHLAGRRDLTGAYNDAYERAEQAQQLKPPRRRERQARQEALD